MNNILNISYSLLIFTLKNQYFINLNKNTLNPFINSQIEFSYAVDHWSKVLGNTISKVPTDIERLILIENLYDEHGNGNITNSHVNTINRLIKKLNNIDHKNNSNASSIFNNELNYIVNNKSWIYTIAVLGIIEFEYIHISKKIHNYLLNFLNESDIEHYTNHEILDIKHSTELFKLIENYENNYYDIYNGLIYGHLIFYNFYLQLYYDFFPTITSE